MASDPAMQPEQTTLMNKLFGPKPPKPAGPGVRSGPVTIIAPLPPTVVADALRAEQQAWVRRVSICTELRRVADETGDVALAQKADDLERKATSLYNARAAALGAPREKAPLPDSAAPAEFEEPASIGPAARRLTKPAAPVEDRSTAEVREVKP
jgi:hypothetical protein